VFFPLICIVELYVILSYGPPLRNSRGQAGRTICAQQLAEQTISESIAFCQQLLYITNV